MYYATKTSDNLEEVVYLHPNDELRKVQQHLIDKYGEMVFTINESGSIKAESVHSYDSYFTIIKG